MTDIDQFESAFKAAVKTPFALENIQLNSIMVITDLDSTAAERLTQGLHTFLDTTAASAAWTVVTNEGFATVSGLLELVQKQAPDLICTYRNLRIPSSEHPYSLGVYVDVLTQTSIAPVMLLPHPKALSDAESGSQNTKSVMAITDHVTGDHRLVSYAAHFTEPGGTLYLTHIEDEAVFERYMTTIGKIPDIDTETARQMILQQLLKEPCDYISSCRKVLEANQVRLIAEQLVVLGHHLTDYTRMISEHAVDLLVMNTRDEDQLAMHGVAYPLTIELRQMPLLLL